MKYYLGVDYFLFYEDFPHMGVPGVIAANSDGTANIYINTLYNPQVQRRATKHELRHLVKNHFSCDWFSITEKELEADDVDDPACVFADDFSSVEYLGPVRRAPADAPTVCRRMPGRLFSIFRSDALPAGAAFAFHVPDDSMQPYFSRDALVCCDLEPLRPGDVGLFLYGGSTLCRQYHKDPFGITYLFMLDRARSHEDIVIPSRREGELRCLGRVMLPAPISLPGLEPPAAHRAKKKN